TGAARRDARVAQDDLPQALFGIADGARREHHLVADALQTVGHDLEEQRFLAVEVVVEAGLGHTQGAGHVADRRGVVAAVAEDLGSRPADFHAAGLRGRRECAHSRHAVQAYTLRDRRTSIGGARFVLSCRPTGRSLSSLYLFRPI